MRRERSMKPRKPVNKNCPFCETKIDPDYKDTQTLFKYMTERGKLMSKARTGVCSKHQRILTAEAKVSRHVALLPFVVRT